MAKKAAAKPIAASPRLKSSSLLDNRVLKTTGCFYYRCDYHASHYLKAISIFGENNPAN